MTYAPPPYGPPPYGPPATPARTARGLGAVGSTLLLQAAVLIAVLVYDLSEAGSAYLPTALGFSYTHVVPGPTSFIGGSAPYLVIILITAFRAFAGAAWTRAAAVVLTGANAYPMVGELWLLFTGPLGKSGYATKTNANLLLTLALVLHVLVFVVIAITVASTRTSTPAPPPAYLPQPPFVPAPGHTPGPTAPPAPSAYSAPAPAAPAPAPAPAPAAPVDGHGAAYAYPPPPPATPPAG
ncbi:MULTISPECIES: hypothetical protein [Kitasatospora]|uniref:Uncharacterized protein n=1 Tax=Kitasatospora setae (strain ATCC 33774 / DSM 43861 / JCM 3304 / KCC A-0304 / NBRC 14216 / KM-6054) TaxID=452652 RepID=E4N9M8_KITSK|nr:MULTISPECIES: hypothetical protein [Kitasatospora]BAJ27909.1 hypothetical protein KSE_20860 [Kitasatospora setae KM-6054]